MIPKMNEVLGETVEPLTLGEFIRFIGLWLMMSCFSGIERKSWWSQTVPTMDRAHGAPYRFNSFMTRNRFDAIVAALRYTDQPVPQFQDRFFQVWQLIDAWNMHMSNEFSSS